MEQELTEKGPPPGDEQQVGSVIRPNLFERIAGQGAASIFFLVAILALVFFIALAAAMKGMRT